MGYVFITGWPRTGGPSGLYQFTYDSETGKMSPVRVIEPGTAFGTVFYNSEKNVVYALIETSDAAKAGIASYHLDKESGEVTLLGKVSSMVPNPAYLYIDDTGKFALAAVHSANGYGVKIEQDKDGRFVPVRYRNDACVILYSVNEDGSLGEVLDVKIHEGSSIKPRQDMAHPHCAVGSPDGRLIAVCDKGTEYVHMYGIDREAGRLQGITKWKEEAGFMPRYAVFHPEKPFFYHNNEGNAIVSAFRYEGNEFTPTGEYAAFDETDIEIEQQGICLHPSGKYLYDALNGPGCIAVFDINQEDGSLTRKQNIGKDYDWLRGIQVSPDGRFLLATYKDSGKAVMFRIREDGTLEETGMEYDVPLAAGIVFIE